MKNQTLVTLLAACFFLFFTQNSPAVEADELLNNASNIQPQEVINSLKNFTLKFLTRVKIYSNDTLISDREVTNILEQEENGFYHFIIENISSGKKLEAKVTASNLYIRRDSEVDDEKPFRKARRFKDFDKHRDNIIDNWRIIFDNYKRFMKFEIGKETESFYSVNGYFAKPLFSDFLHEIKNCTSKIYIDKGNGIVLTFSLGVKSKNLKESSFLTETNFLMEINKGQKK